MRKKRTKGSREIPPPALMFSRELGLILGHALGDAAGAFFEFRMNIPREEVDGFFETFEHRVNYFKRDTKWDWTDDTDQMILIMEMLVETGGRVDAQVLAKKLRDWVEGGFPELGDKKGEGCGGHSLSVISSEDFPRSPIEISKTKFFESGRAANGAVMRTSILACCNDGYEKIMRDAALACRITHYSPLCVISCQVQVTLLLGILRGWEDGETLGLARKIVGADRRAEEYFDNSDSLDALVLNDTHMGFTLKTMGVGLWAFKNKGAGFLPALKEIFYRGGDVDTNSAVGGAILGASCGIENVPPEWLEKLPNLEWLKPKIQKYLDVMYRDNQETFLI